MVKKVFLLFSREISGLHQAAAVLAFFTFLSQLLGLLRDRLLAHMFGAGTLLDIYYASFRIPDLVLVLLASVVSLSILVPALTEKLEGEHGAARRFLDSIATVFAITIIAVSVFLFILMPLLIPLFFPGFEAGSEIQEVVTLTRLLLLSPILLGFSNLLSSVVQVKRRFLVYSLSPIFYNVGIIFGILLLYPLFGLMGLGLGVVLGAFLHLLIQLPTVARARLTPRFTLRVHMNEVRDLVLTSLPRALTLSTNQIVLLVFVGLASSLATGSIAVMNFSLNLQSVPLALIGVSYSLAAFPTLSKYFAEGNFERFRESLSTALRHIVFWSLPALVLFVVLRAHIVRVVLGSGAFDWGDTRLTAAALALFVLSLVAQSVTLILVRAYYASGNTKKPLAVAMAAGAFSIILGVGGITLFTQVELLRFFFESLFRVSDIEGTTVLALPLAFSVGACLNAYLLWHLARFDFDLNIHRLSQAFFHGLGAAIIMGFGIRLFLGFLSPLVTIENLIGIFLQGVAAGGVGILIFVLVLLLLKNEELEEVRAAVRARLWRVELLPEEQTEL